MQGDTASSIKLDEFTACLGVHPESCSCKCSWEPVVSIAKPDSVVWPYVKSGICSAKSAYYRPQGKCIETRVSETSSSLNLGKDEWKRPWNIDTLPKIRHFLWQAMSNTVALVDNLRRRHASVSPCCSFCRMVETIEHALLSCGWIEGVWFSVLELRVDKAAILTLCTWWLGCAHALSDVGKDWRDFEVKVFEKL